MTLAANDSVPSLALTEFRSLNEATGNNGQHVSVSRYGRLQKSAPSHRRRVDGDNPLRLAEEIDAALDKNGLGNKHHLFTSIKFFEGELRPIAD